MSKRRPFTIPAGRFTARAKALTLVALGATALSSPPGWTQAPGDTREAGEVSRPEWAARRARGEMVPGTIRYTGNIRVQGQTNPIALTTTIEDGGEDWVVEESWAIGGTATIETSRLEKDTLFLRWHRSDNGTTSFEFEVRDGWVAGWTVTPDSPDPREQIYIDAPEPILGYGAGVPQVIATLPLARGYTRKLWNIRLPDRVVPRTLEVGSLRKVRIPAGESLAWTVVVRSSEPDGHDLALWVDAKTRQVLRYDGRTFGAGPSWTLFLEP